MGIEVVDYDSCYIDFDNYDTDYLGYTIPS